MQGPAEVDGATSGPNGFEGGGPAARSPGGIDREIELFATSGLEEGWDHALSLDGQVGCVRAKRAGGGESLFVGIGAGHGQSFAGEQASEQQSQRSGSEDDGFDVVARALQPLDAGKEQLAAVQSAGQWLGEGGEPGVE